HGVPETTFPILETSRILRHIRRTLEAESFEPNVSAPVCVHCSAGVGRTGTFIGAHMTTESILDEGLRELDIFSMVKHLRKQRQKMVQSL
ncbi:Receptortype tyrosineprotein phosphatase epsilonlike, partial [Caligus rogercresseyi]